MTNNRGKIVTTCYATLMDGHEIPSAVTDALATLHQAYRQASSRGERERAGAHLAAYLQQGRERDWSLEDLAEPLEMSGERVRQLIKQFHGSGDDGAWPELPAFPQRSGPRRRRVRPVKPRRPSAIGTELQVRLAELAPLAAKTNGTARLDSPQRRASEEFSQLIIDLHEAGHTWQQIADASGLSTNGVRMRAARHGYKEGPPRGVPAYRRIDRHSPEAVIEVDAATHRGEHAVGATRTRSVAAIHVSGSDTVTVSIPPAQLAFLDAYTAHHAGATRESAVQDAIALLRQVDLEAQYEQADAEWLDSDDAAAWEAVIADGLTEEGDDAPR